MPDPGRLVLIAGPSCAGKSPLLHALRRARPDLADRLEPVVLYNDRAPRPGEVDAVDYHFRRRDHIESLRGDDRYAVIEARGDLQALDVHAVEARLREGDAIFEGNPYVAAALLDEPRLGPAPKLGVFVAPLTREELEAMHGDARIDAPHTVADVMRRKLLRRARRQRGELSRVELDDAERRARRAYHELTFAPRFTHVLPNHDGEDSENWGAFPLPLGDARRTLHALIALLEGHAPGHAQAWPHDLFR